METIHKYAGTDPYQTIPESLVDNAIALYTTRPQGLSDFAVMISSDFTTAEMNAIFGAGNHPTAGEIAGMKAYKGKETWVGLEPVVINPNDKYYWPDRSGAGRHLHFVNLAYDATGGLQAGPPANYLFDGVNDYGVYNSATDIVAANGAVSAFVVFQAVGSVAATHRVAQFTNAAGYPYAIAMVATPTNISGASVDTSGAPSSLSNNTGTYIANKWYSMCVGISNVDKKNMSSLNGGTIVTSATALTNIPETKRITLSASGALSTGYSNSRFAEVYLFNKVLTQAEIKQLHNNIASRYGLTKV